MSSLRCTASIRTNSRFPNRMAAILVCGAVVLAGPVADARESVDVRVMEDTFSSTSWAITP